MAKVSYTKFKNLNSTEKISALESEFFTGYDDTNEVLKIYSLALRDEDIHVRRRAADMASMLTPALQQYQIPEKAAFYFGEDFVMPKFSKEDTDEFQIELLKAMNSDDNRLRSSSFTALIYCFPPDEELAKMYTAKLSLEKDEKVKNSMMKSMAMTGYQSDEFVSILLELLGPKRKENLTYQAGRCLSTIKAKSALDVLIQWIDNEEAAQEEIFNVLASYGADAKNAKTGLMKVLGDLSLPNNILITANRALTAITNDEALENDAYEILDMKALWQVNLPINKKQNE